MEEVAFAAAEPRLAILPSRKRVRVILAGETVADSVGTRLLLEKGRFPVYYFPPGDVRSDLLRPSATRTHCPWKGEASYRHLAVGGRQVEDAVWCYEAPIESAQLIAGRYAFYWDKVDRWLEEDEVLIGHVRSPFHRIDTRATSRAVRVVAGGEVVAETRRAVLLFETGIRPRAYIPPEDVAREFLVPTGTRSVCPYKGEARYWTVEVAGRRFEDAVWCYEQPFPEAAPVKGLLAFWDEKIEKVEIASH